MTLLAVQTYPRTEVTAAAPSRGGKWTGTRDDGIRPPTSSQARPEQPEERVLRAKYFDWCSARVAERFVSLDVKQIYELAGIAAQGPEIAFPEIVDRATEALAAQMDLPAFEDWAVSYRAAPQRYDEDLAGFWKEQT